MNRREAFGAMAGVIAVPALPPLMKGERLQMQKEVPSRVEYKRLLAQNNRTLKFEKRVSEALDQLSREGYEMIAVVPFDWATQYIFARRVPLEASA